MGNGQPKGKGENVRFVGNGKPLWGEPFDRLRATSNVEWGGHAVAESEGVPGEGVQ